MYIYIITYFFNVYRKESSRKTYIMDLCTSWSADILLYIQGAVLVTDTPPAGEARKRPPSGENFFQKQATASA